MVFLLLLTERNIDSKAWSYKERQRPGETFRERLRDRETERGGGNQEIKA